MVSADVGARLRFLDHAPEVLAVTAPVASSYIRATKREAALLQDSETASLANVCDGCGQLLLIGWSCEPLRMPQHRQTRQQRISGRTETSKRIQCSTCGTENTIHHHKRRKTNFSKPANQVQQAKADPVVSKEQPTPALPEQPPIPAHVSSKEQTPENTQAKPTARRKARGKNATLQALMANKKSDAPKSSGLGLDLMDFMK